MAEMDNVATITVIIPTYNRRAMLERAIRSVLDEQRVPIRLQVHDNASTDDTESFMQALAAQDERVVYIRNPTDVGGTQNIIDGLLSIRSAYFVPLADDDYLLPNFLFDAYTIMQADAELAATCFYAEARDASGRIINTWPNHVQRLVEGKRQPADHLREWMTGSHYSWQSVLWHSRVLDHVGAPFIHTGPPSDVDFQAQIFAAFPVYVVSRPGSVFFVHDGQASHGLSMADVPCWAKLFARLDRTVHERNLFLPAEYAVLRAIMWQRMRPSWTRPSRAPFSLAAFGRIILDAGFRLGDWELAFNLASELKKYEEGASISGRLSFLTQVMQQLQGSIQRENALSSQVTALTASLKLMQEAAVAVTTDRNRLAAQLSAQRA